MNITPVISQLEAERDKISQAITVLESVNSTFNIPNSNKTPRKYAKSVTPINVPKKGNGPRHMSAAARLKISRAAKARWRKFKQEQKAAA